MQRHVAARYFLIGLMPIVIFAQDALISGQMLDADLPVSPDILGDGWGWEETAGRYRFLAATWMFAGLAFLVFVMAVIDLRRAMTQQTQVLGAAVLALIFAIALSPSIGFMQDPDALRIYDRLGGDVFKVALGQGRLPGCDLPQDRWLLGTCGDIPVISLLNRMFDVINIAAGLGVGGLAVGMILCLKVGENDNLETRASRLERNMLQMRRQLYLSGLVLTFGVFFVISWMRWPLPMIDAAHAEAYGAVISAAMLYTGVYFSLLILSFYLPVALVLEGRKQKLAELAEADGKLADYAARKKWLEMRGLNTNPAEFLKSGLALVAPILTAYAGSFPSLL